MSFVWRELPDKILKNWKLALVVVAAVIALFVFVVAPSTTRRECVFYGTLVGIQVSGSESQVSNYLISYPAPLVVNGVVLTPAARVSSCKETRLIGGSEYIELTP